MPAAVGQRLAAGLLRPWRCGNRLVRCLVPARFGRSRGPPEDRRRREAFHSVLSQGISPKIRQCRHQDLPTQKHPLMIFANNFRMAGIGYSSAIVDHFGSPLGHYCSSYRSSLGILYAPNRTTHLHENRPPF